MISRVRSQSELPSAQLSMYLKIPCTPGVSRNSVSWALWSQFKVAVEVKRRRLPYSLWFQICYSPYRTIPHGPRRHQVTEQECPWGTQQQCTTSPAWKLHSVPWFSLGHLRCKMSSAAPSANAFSEGRLIDFKHEFLRQSDAMHVGANIQS